MSFFRENPDALAKFRAGDEAVLERIYRAYVRQVAMVVRSGTLAGQSGHVSGVPRDQQYDLIQETFVRAFSERTRMSYDGLRDYQPYLLTICRNLVVEYWRQQGREVSLPDDFADSAVAPEASEDSDAVVLSAVQGYVASLPKELRSIYESRYVACLSQVEAADSLGLTRQKVRTHEGKLRAGLRALLRRRSIFPKA